MGVEAENPISGLSISLLSEGEDNPDIGDADFVGQPFVENGYDLDDALEATGNGGFQIMLATCIFLAWSFNSMVTMVTPFFMTGMRKEFGLSPEQEGITAAALLFGFIVGNLVWGQTADKAGRRPCILLSVLGVGLFNSAAAFGQAWWHVAILRAVVGFFIPGSMVGGNSLVSELVPRSSRGAWLVFLHVSWQFGTLAMVFISYELRGREEWRLLMLAMGAPAIVILIVMFLLAIPESPRYLLVMKRREETLEVLERVARMNGASLPDSELMDVPPHPTVRPFQEIFNASLFARTTLPLWAMFFWLNYASYGMSMWLKAYLGRVGMSDETRDVYIWFAVGKILGVMVCAMFIEHLPRRRVLAIAFTMAGICTFTAVMMHGGDEVWDDSVITITGDTLVLFWFAAAAFFEEASWGAIYTYSVEVYPSSIRSTGSGAAMSFGRLGGIIATTIGKTLMEEDPRLPFYLVALSFLLAAVGAGVARVETRGMKLPEVS